MNGHATWNDAKIWAYNDIAPGRPNASNDLISLGRVVKSAGDLGGMAVFAPTIDLVSNGLCEVRLRGPNANAEWNTFLEQLGVKSDTFARAWASGEGPDVFVRIPMRLNEYNRQAILAGFGKTLRDGVPPTAPIGILGRPALAVTIAGRTLVPAEAAPIEMPQPLIDYLIRYQRELSDHARRQQRAEQISQEQLAEAFPAQGARRLRYDLRLQHRAAHLVLTAGTMVDSPELIAEIHAADPAALIGITDAPSLPPLKPGEARFKRRFGVVTLPIFGSIDAPEGRVIQNVDPAFVLAVRRAGGEIESYDDTITASPETRLRSRAKEAVPA